MRRTVFCAVLSLLALALAPAPGAAVIGTIDNVPAATLLLPYFEVDLVDPRGIKTLLSINNASASAVVAHVTIWSDLSVPVLDFDVYLTGYDVQTINLRNVIQYGRLPRTADLGADPGDTISPQGPYSQDINFPGVTGPCFTPYSDPQLTGALLTYLQRALTGLGADPFTGAGSRCYGRAFGDNVARGYVTVDAVSACSLLFPGEPGYFGSGIPTDHNVLWGDYFYVEPAQDFAQGETLVHVESAGPGFFAPGDYTFYGRHVNWLGTDNREPLGSSFALRYLNGGAFDGGTDLIVWRDAKVAVQSFACSVPYPLPFPLAETEVVAFDEAEDAEELCGGTGSNVSPPTNTEEICFPLEAQRISLLGGNRPGDDPTPSWDFGWMYLNLNHSFTGDPFAADGGTAQNFVTVVMKAEGRYAVGFDAMQLDNVWLNPSNVIFD